MSKTSVTCPVCRRTSHHHDDIREGYCGFCHDWTSPPHRPVAERGTYYLPRLPDYERPEPGAGPAG